MRLSNSSNAMHEPPMADAPSRRTDAWLGWCLVACIALAFGAATIAIVEWRYLIFRNEVDLGIFTQVIAGIGSGFSSTAEGRVNHLLVHWSPILVLGWPFLRVFGPVGLEIFQALLVASTVIPVWGLARARFGTWSAAGVTAVAALYPILCANAVADFHEMAFVPVLSATLVYALDQRRYRLGIAAAVLLACTKEDQFVVLAFNGLAIFATAKGDEFSRRFGRSVALVAVAGAVLYFGIVRNVMQPHLTFGALHFYDWSAAAEQTPALAALLLPRLWYVLHVFVPLLFLPLISRYGLFLIPGLLVIMAAHEPVVLAPGEHYSALLTGYALAAFVDGLGRLPGVRLRFGAAAAAAIASILIAIYASPMEYWYYLYRPPNQHDALLERTVQSLPAAADVGAEDEIFSHLGLNPKASIDMLGQQWFVFDRTHYSERWHAIDAPAVNTALRSHAYAVVSERDGIVVLRRN